MRWDDVFAWRGDAVPLAPIEYNGWLILLSVMIAMLGGVAAMQLIGVARNEARFGRVLATGAYVAAVLALGASVWSMHFIGMLAVDLCQPVTYDETITALSILPSLAASAVGLRLFLRSEVSLRQTVHAGIWLGAGIGVMHYSGMGAMEMASVIRYDPLWFAASLVVAITLAITGLAARSVLRTRWQLPSGQASLVSGAILGLAVSGMHYTAMQASLFVGGAQADYVPWSSRQLELSLAVAAVTVFVFGVSWGTVALTAYRNTANRLAERERLLSDILQNLPGAVVRIALPRERGADGACTAGRQLLASPTLADLTGHPVDTAEDARWRLPECVLPEDRPALERAIDIALADGDREQATVRLQHASGSLRRINVRVQALPSDGADALVDLYLSDVTDEHEVRARERQLLAAIDQVIGRAVLSPQGIFIEANARLSQTLGHRSGELQGQPHRVVWPEAAPGEVERFWNALRAGEAQHGEFARVARDGGARHLQGWYQPLRNAEGQVHAVLKLVIDVTERVRMVEDLMRTEAELRSALASRSAFFANVSHEIRTPMNAVVGFAELLRDDLNDPRKRGQAQSILDAARALLRILNDLLDAAKLDRGEFALVDAPFRIDRLVNGLVSQFGAMASAKGLDLRLELAPSAPRCFSGDGDRVRQILTNLLGNAIKFTEAGHVVLRVAHDGEALLLAVDDSGIGIPLDRQQAIFDPFVQADAGTARRYGGTGLGMGIVKQLAERMGGRVALESAPGRGTTVRVELPLPVLPDSACADVVPTPAAHAGAPLRLLAVDDVAQNREVLEALLARAGHAVTVCASAADLLARFEAGPADWDAVLLDLHMPGMDGFTAARRLRAFEARHGLAARPVFALSASVHEDDRRDAQAAGMDGFLEKPIDVDALYRALGGVVRAVAGVASSIDRAAIDRARGEALWGAAWEARLRDWKASVDEAWDGASGWAAEDWHRVAGAAANFALTDVADAARRAEAAVRRGRPAAVDEARQAWSALGAWLAAQPVAAAGVESGVGPAAVGTLAARVDAEALIDALEAALARSAGGEIDDAALAVLDAADPARAALLRRAFDDFDFDEAQRRLAAWRQEMPAVEADR